MQRAESTPKVSQDRQPAANAKPKRTGKGGKAKAKPILILLLAATVIVVFIIARKRVRKARTKAPEGVQQITYWQRNSADGVLLLTLIQSSSGLRMLDECDQNGEGVVTVYHSRNHPARKRCYSLVKQSAGLYNRRTLELLKTECVQHFNSVRQDFADAAPVKFNTSTLDPPSFDNVLAYFKENSIVVP